MWILGAIQAGLGLYQTIRGVVEQQKLSKMQAPKYGLTASMKAAKGQAEQMAQMGYTPQERAAFEQRLATYRDWETTPLDRKSTRLNSSHRL